MLILYCVISSAAVKKSNLRILYVGGSSDYETIGVDIDSSIVAASAKERMTSFEKFLKGYFKVVKVIHAEQYTYSMSDNYDVTILDGTPKPLRPKQILRDENGRYKGTIEALYFPQDFDRPVITIAELGNTVGRGIGLKTDWYCLCLDADAHHLVKDHPIFNGPWKTQLTITLRPTPEDAKYYTYFYDAPLPDSTMMWTVQKRGYMTEPGFRIGMVARPWGFTDSPDAEYISSGVCAKTIDAVAVGRHANFLHWGFSASPDDMTDEARVVFANAVVYISQFAGQHPLARKYNDRRGTREYLKELKYLSTRDSWMERQISDSIDYAEIKRVKDRAVNKQKNGEQLSNEEKMFLDFEIPRKLTYEEYLIRYQKETFKKFGANEKAYTEYYDLNKPYFYCPDALYVIEVDEDVKSLGIANNDIRLLDKAISMWEESWEMDKARRILYRYTLCRFDTPQEWRQWYETYKDKLFFTESGGWLWLVNTTDPNVPGNDYSILEKEIPAQTTNTAGQEQTTHETPVIAKAEYDVAGKQILIRMKIHPGYHIYGKVSSSDPYIPTEIKVELSSGWQKEGDLLLPAFKQLNSSGTTIYEDDIVFRQKIKGNGKGTATVTVSWQCCDDHICMPPTEQVFTVSLK